MIPPIGIFTEVVVFAFGMWIGRRLTTPSPGEVTVGWREMWRHGPGPLRRQNPKNSRVAVGAFGGAFIAFALRMLAYYIDSMALAPSPSG